MKKLVCALALNVLAACGTAPDADLDGAAETGAEALTATCPGRKPPAAECMEVYCLVGDQSWDDRPLPAGKACRQTGYCDGRGSCVVPATGQQTLAIAGGDVNSLIAVALRQSQVVVDTTGKSPELVLSSHTECHWDPRLRDEICGTYRDSHHSYVKFTDRLKGLYQSETGKALADYGFDVQPFCKLGVCAKINWMRSDLDSASVAFQGTSSGPRADLTLPITSEHPTLLIDFPVPNLDLTNVSLTLGVGLQVGTDGASLAASNVDATLAFDRNLTHFPDRFVTAFVDIDAQIRAGVKAKVEQAFSDPARRDVLARTLTRAVGELAKLRDSRFTGFKTIVGLRAQNGTLNIDYVPL